MIKKFRDGVGFSFWHLYSSEYGTALRWKRLHPGLFGIKFVRHEYSPYEIESVQVGFWWTVQFDTCAFHLPKKPDSCR